jgi:hypothetical protein
LNPLEEKKIRQTFDSFCKKLLKNTARELYRKQQREAKREVPFSELSSKEFSSLYAEDSYGMT